MTREILAPKLQSLTQINQKIGLAMNKINVSRKSIMQASIGILLLTAASTPAMALNLDIRIGKPGAPSFIGFTKGSECYYKQGCVVFSRNCKGRLVLVSRSTKASLLRYYRKGYKISVGAGNGWLCRFKR